MAIDFKYVNGDKLGPKFKFGVQRYGKKVIRASQQTARIAVDEIEAEGRANIAAGGDFSSERWQRGFRARLSFTSRTDMSIRITHDVPYWVVFEEGRIIQGKPLLWIPLSFSDAVGIRASEYGALFRVNRKSGAPLLLSKDDKQPKYFGKEQVTIPQKFHIREIIERVASRMGEIFKSKLR